jgi:hypothetical protein
MGIFDLKPYDWGDYLTVQDIQQVFGQEAPYIDFEYELFKKFKLEFFYPHNGAKIQFKAFINNYSESFSSNYTPVSVYGRMDPTMHFQSTTRNLNLSWTAPAASVEEALLNLQNASKLARIMYPVYGPNQGVDAFFGPFQDATDIKAPPRVILRFSNLIKRTGTAGETTDNISTSGLHGVIQSYQWQPVGDDGYFDGPAPVLGSSSPALLPKTLSFSIGFSVTHRDTNGWSEDGQWLGDPSFPWLPGESGPVTLSNQNRNSLDIGPSNICEAAVTAVADEDGGQAALDECLAEIGVVSESISTELEL